MKQKSTIIRKVWTDRTAKLITIPKDCLDIKVGDYVFVTKMEDDEDGEKHINKVC